MVIKQEDVAKEAEVSVKMLLFVNEIWVNRPTAIILHATLVNIDEKAVASTVLQHGTISMVSTR